MAMSMTVDNYYKANNISLHYSVNGSGNPIVLIHGNFMDSRIWEYQIEELSNKNKVVSYDLRGYGKSDIPRSSFSHVEDLKSLIDYLDINDVTLVGSSLGGSIAIDFALKHPNLVQKLVLIAPALTGYKYPFRLNIEVMQNLLTKKMKGSQAAIEKFIASPYWEYMFPSQENKVARDMVLDIIRDEKNFYSWNPSLYRPADVNSINRLSNIKAPTLIVLSDRDKEFNIKVGNYIHENIKKSKKLVIADCGHLPFVERPQEFNRIVLDFL